MYFLSSDGNPMLKNIPNEFSKNFDWVVTKSHLYKFKDIPETIYVKVDFLPFLLIEFFPQLRINLF